MKFSIKASIRIKLCLAIVSFLMAAFLIGIPIPNAYLKLHLPKPNLEQDFAIILAIFGVLGIIAIFVEKYYAKKLGLKK